jgi:2-hydroxychromene-2-carboxylate isomerase
MTDSKPLVEMFFSFRSPYAWFGFERLWRVSEGLAIDVDYVPVFPPPGVPEPRITADPRHRRYMLEDVERIGRAYGYAIRWPEAMDTDWMRPHAAAAFALQSGSGPEFISAVFRARFEGAADLGEDAVLAAAGEAAGLDGAAVVAAADDPEWHQAVQRGFPRAGGVELLGVPFFVFQGQRYWGNDRLEWLLRAVQQERGEPVPDLKADPFSAPLRPPLV